MRRQALSIPASTCRRGPVVVDSTTPSRRTSLNRIPFGLAASALSLQVLAASPASHTIVDLGADQQPSAVNDKGKVVGYSISTRLPAV